MEQELFQAAYLGDINLINDLIQTPGINVNVADLEGSTVVWYAVSGGNIAVLQRLIEAGADVNLPPGSLVNPPLLVAIHKGREEMVDMLLTAGADVNATHRTTSVLACTIGAFWNPRIVSKLIQAPGVNVNFISDAPGSTAPLHTAAIFNRLEAMQWLLLAGADPNIRTSDKYYVQAGCTPIYYAALCAGRGGIELLIDAGADVNAQNKLGDTALHIAAARGSLHNVELLLNSGADPFIRNAKGRTALQAAASRFSFYELHDDPAIGEPWFPIISRLVAVGDRNWDYVPVPCPGLGQALLPVWKDAPQDLPELFARLPKQSQNLVRTCLRVMHCGLHMPEELRMLVLAAVLQLEET